MNLKTALLIAFSFLLHLSRLNADPASELDDAAQRGDLAVVSALITQGASVNGATPDGYTPLMGAGSEGHLDVMAFLIAHGANVNQGDNDGSTCLLHACHDNQTAVALALLKAGANPNIGSHWNRFPLMYAANHGNDEIVSALLAAKADTAATCNEGPAIVWAAWADYLSTVKILIAGGAAVPTGGIDSDGDTMVGVAAAKDDPEMIDLFLSKGCDVNTPASDGSTPLIAAAQYGAVKATGHLLLKGAKINAQNQLGQTALATAIINKSMDVFQILLDNHAGLEIKDKNGYTPLIQACALRENDMANELLDHGADVNATDNNGETALTHAGSTGETELVQALESHGAKQTALHVLAEPDPPVPLTKAQAWALAVGAVYSQRFGLNPKMLGGGDLADNARSMLSGSWGITDKAGLLKEIEDLKYHGHHEVYQKEGFALISMTNDDFEKYLAGHPDRVEQIKAERKGYLIWKDRSGLAWDLCRASMLANEGYAANYLSASEAFDALIPVAEETQKNFSSWQEMSANFLDGRLIWESNPTPDIPACAKLLLNPKDPNSPWNYLPWKTDLRAAE